MASKQDAAATENMLLQRFSFFLQQTILQYKVWPFVHVTCHTNQLLLSYSSTQDYCSKDKHTAKFHSAKLLSYNMFGLTNQVHFLLIMEHFEFQLINTIIDHVQHYFSV